jgi:transposase
MPLTTTVVSGECADDPLYVPDMRKVHACIQRHGVLYVGDCKMAALQALLEPVWAGVQPLAPVHRPPEKESGEPEHIADGFSCTVTLAADCEGDRIEWQEQRLVVRSLKQAASQEKAIAGLNLRGRGRKCLDEDGLRGAADGILEGHDVAGLLVVEITRETQTARKRGYGKRAAETVAVTTLTACASRDAAACAGAVRMLGWRVFACNDLELSLAEAVLAYREQYVIERGFNRLRGKTLGITPLFLSSTTRIKGLIRLLGIALRVLCLVEFAVRKALQEEGSKLDGIYAGNPKRATARPTTEMMLNAFRGLNLIVIRINEVDRCCMTALNAVQTRILGLIGFPPTLYQGIEIQSGKLVVKMGEP